MIFQTLNASVEKICNNFVTNKNCFEKIFESGCKTEKKTGLEYEKIYVKEDFSPASYEEIRKLTQIFSKSENGELTYENGFVTGADLKYGKITFEPGAQLEISLNPTERISDHQKIIDRYNEKTDEIAKALGLRHIPCGNQPKTTFEGIKIIPKERYRMMTKYLQNKAECPFVMMRETAGIQTSIDYSSEEDACVKLKTAIKLSPIVSAMFANSPLRKGKPSGMKSFRSFAWLNTDNDRCGLIGKKLFTKEFFGFSDYTEILLDVPTIFIEKNGKYLQTGGLTFGEYMKKGFDGYFPTQKDVETHISLYFTDVRLKTYLEIRNHDSQKNELIFAVPALWKGILYDNSAICEINDIFKKATYDDFEELRAKTPQTGINTEFCGQKLSEICKEILEISEHNLKKTDEQKFLYPLKELISKGLTPADKILEKYALTKNLHDLYL